MKASFNLPTSTYNIILTKEELDFLVKTEFISVPISRIPCSSSRLIKIGDDRLISIGKSTVPHNLRFDLTETIADIPPDDWGIQYFSILLEKK